MFKFIAEALVLALLTNSALSLSVDELQSYNLVAKSKIESDAPRLGEDSSMGIASRIGAASGGGGDSSIGAASSRVAPAEEMVAADSAAQSSTLQLIDQQDDQFKLQDGKIKSG